MPTPDHTLASSAARSRHVSIRVPVELFEQLESLAGERHETVSQAARRLISAGVAPGGRHTIDDAISTLIAIRDRFPRPVPGGGGAGHRSAPTQRSAPKRIDILNAKTDLQRLIADVAHGAEFVITHAGAPRARLVAVDDQATH